jgi:cyclophilin family peptidyl-prolyl cis-trans isomerase
MPNYCQDEDKADAAFCAQLTSRKKRPIPSATFSDRQTLLAMAQSEPRQGSSDFDI